MIKKPKLTAIKSGSTHVNEKTMKEFYDEITADTLARTIWGEGRGEGTQGMQAIANVILNRARIAEKRGSFWWGNNIIQICQKPYQFSCWNRSDPNFRKLQATDEKNLYFATAKRIASRAIAGALEDITNGATHYHANTLTPYWAYQKTPCKILGNHIFYALAR